MLLSFSLPCHRRLSACRFIASSSAAFVLFSELLIFVESFPFLVDEIDVDQVFPFLSFSIS